MKRRVDLIDQFADLVVGADDPRRLAERTLEVVMSLNNGRSGAVFSCEDDRVTRHPPDVPGADHARSGVGDHIANPPVPSGERSPECGRARDAILAATPAQGPAEFRCRILRIRPQSSDC